MSKGLPRSLSRGAAIHQPVSKHTFVVRDAILNVDGASGVGYGSVVIGDFPQGNILLLGAVAYMQFTGPTDDALADTWAGDYGIGTTPAGDATITNADVDLIESTAIAAATAEASPRTRGVTGTTGVILDNTDGSLEINLNLLIDDANISGDDLDMTVNGELFVAYTILGDD